MVYTRPEKDNENVKILEGGDIKYSKRKKDQLQRAQELLQDSFLTRLEKPKEDNEEDYEYIQHEEIINEEIIEELDHVPKHKFMRMHFPAAYTTTNFNKNIKQHHERRITHKDQIFIKQKQLPLHILVNMEEVKEEIKLPKKVWETVKNVENDNEGKNYYIYLINS